MSICVLWLDSENAEIFHVSAAEVTKKTVKLKLVKHSNSHQQEHHNQAEEKFFHQITGELEQADEILIFGPGMAKKQFKNHLENHHHKALLDRVVAIEPLDRVSDNQILAASRKFFKKYNTFHFSI